MKKYSGSWFLIGILIALVTFPLLVGCGPTFKEMVAALPDEERAVVESAIAVVRASSFEGLDAATTADVVFISSYLSWDGTGKATFTSKMAYWKAILNKKKGDFAGRTYEIRDLKVNIIGNTAEVTYVLDVIQKGGGNRDWKGSVNYLFKLRREGGVWKVFYFEQ